MNTANAKQVTQQMNSYFDVFLSNAEINQIDVEMVEATTNTTLMQNKNPDLCINFLVFWKKRIYNN